ncbi:MAG: hypothetical protein N3G74_02665 [Candidatus Micrarchaeota archaeon]|nr:hypothetical protein [Candidatus Micrarchaeota archaeon]
MRCQICGKETSAGEGYDTILGFVCINCYNARDFKLCAECGRRFPRDEMIEWNGLFYCRSDYFEAKERLERIKEEERKKKEAEEARKRPPLVKPGTGIGIPLKWKKERISEDELKLLLREKREHKERKERHEKRTEREEGEDLGSLLKSLSNVTSKPLEATADALTEPLGDISLSKSGKEKRKDAISDALNELNELLRGKKKGR